MNVRIRFIVAAVATLLFAVAARAATVTVITHGYDGRTEASGRLSAFRYTGGRMVVDLTPAGNGIFRGGFER